MVERIIQHKHCIQCRKAIPSEEEYCSEICKEHHQILIKRRQKYVNLMYVFMMIVIAGYILIFI